MTSYGGSATYAHKLLDGSFNSSVSVTANTADKTGEDTLGFSTNENYSSLVLGWHVTGSFGYAQNVQTLLVTYMNSFYNYSGNVRRRWGKFNVSAGAGGARTALTQQAGTANSSQSYNAGVGYGAWLTATGSYSKASGQALATGAGLVPVPVPSPILPSSLVSLFGGDSYSVGLSSTPVKRLIIAAAYAKSISNTSSDAVTSANQNNQFNSLIQYQFRKLNFTSGYSRLEQGFSGSGTPPELFPLLHRGITLVQLLLRRERRQCSGAAIDPGWRRAVAGSDLGIPKIQASSGRAGAMGDVARRRAQALLGAQFQLRI